MGQKAIWDYFQGDGVSSFDGNYPRLKYLLSLIAGNQIRVLNIGVGNGAFEKLALKMNKEVYSIDPSKVAIDKLISEQNMAGRAFIGFSESIPFQDNYFDVVVISEVLEHLDNDILLKSLKEIKRVLNAGGTVIGTVPSRENLDEQIVICPDCSKRFHRWGHVQTFDRKRLSDLIEEHFFGQTRVYEKYFVSWQQLNFKGKLVAFIKTILFTIGIRASSENLIFVAKKGD